MARFICLRPLMGALALALLLATPSRLAAEEPRRGGTAIVVIGADPAILNPNVTVGAPDVLTGCMLYDGLVRFAEGGAVFVGHADQEFSSVTDLVEDVRNFVS